jgi:hypothetical protein
MSYVLNLSTSSSYNIQQTSQILRSLILPELDVLLARWSCSILIKLLTANLTDLQIFAV